jgi:hypothetical protein
MINIDFFVGFLADGPEKLKENIPINKIEIK